MKMYLWMFHANVADPFATKHRLSDQEHVGPTTPVGTFHHYKGCSRTDCVELTAAYHQGMNNVKCPMHSPCHPRSTFWELNSWSPNQCYSLGELYNKDVKAKSYFSVSYKILSKLLDSIA
jgi:hypothetical protein